MKKQLSKITVLAAASLLAASTLVNAHHLPAPTGVGCPIVGDVIEAGWDDVAGATKYSVNVVATYDTGVAGDMTDDTTIDWDFGTGDRTDGNPISQSDLTIPLSALSFDFGARLSQPLLPNSGLRACTRGRTNNSRIICFLVFAFPPHRPYKEMGLWHTEVPCFEVPRCFFPCTETHQPASLSFKLSRSAA